MCINVVLNLPGKHKHNLTARRKFKKTNEFRDIRDWSEHRGTVIHNPLLLMLSMISGHSGSVVYNQLPRILSMISSLLHFVQPTHAARHSHYTCRPYPHA